MYDLKKYGFAILCVIWYMALGAQSSHYFCSQKDAFEQIAIAVFCIVVGVACGVAFLEVLEREMRERSAKLYALAWMIALAFCAIEQAGRAAGAFLSCAHI